MERHDIRIYLDEELSEDAGYEVTRQIKGLPGVQTVTLSSENPHYGLVVLADSADRDAIADSVRQIPGIIAVELPGLAA